MAEPTRVAVLGAGVIAASHLKGYAAHPTAGQVQVVVDLDESRAAARAAEFGVPEAATSAEAVLQRDDIDAVSLCLPHSLHEQYVVAAAAAGKHILCEKPCALSVASLDRMIAACAAAGVVGMSAQVLRFRSVFGAAREFIRSGRLGTIHQTWRRRGGISRTLDVNPWIYSRREGSLTIHGLGAHEYDILMWLQSAPCQKLYAAGRANNPIWDTVDEVSAIFHLADGSIANMRQSLNTLDGGWDEVIMAQQGCLKISADRFEWQPFDGEREVHEHPLDPTAGFAGECGEFLAAIRAGREPEASMRQARWVQATMEAVEISIAEERVVDLREQFGEFGPLSVS
ncbi:MAG: Gfo/Idh/MocA family oxidoreductase [Fimbriimonadaceae bacterium]|nr:Gfo/Idh/MocA family oxidoreductase [Fimbriimonadaceae bacterium]